MKINLFFLKNCLNGSLCSIYLAAYLSWYSYLTWAKVLSQYCGVSDVLTALSLFEVMHYSFELIKGKYETVNKMLKLIKTIYPVWPLWPSCQSKYILRYCHQSTNSDINKSNSSATGTTHFGFETVRENEKEEKGKKWT